MSREPSLRLWDVIEACERVEIYISGMDFAAFQEDFKTQDAVIRQFEIIGEAIKAIPESLTAREPDIPWRNIAGFRDVLAHSYFAVDASVVWEAASIHAARLRNACQRLVASLHCG